MKQILDGESYALANGVLARALKYGLDPIEALHQAGLLLTHQRDREIRAQAMNRVLNSFRAWRADEFLRRNYIPVVATPSDMHACIADWLEEFVRTEEKK